MEGMFLLRLPRGAVGGIVQLRVSTALGEKVASAKGFLTAKITKSVYLE